MGMTNAERQAKFRARKAAQGLEQVNVLLPPAAHADLAMIARMMAENPDLEFGPLRDTRTGRLVKIR